jgi:hypothetical protein
LKQFWSGELVRQECGNTGQANAGSHVMVYAQHESAKADVYRRGAIFGEAGRS